MPQIVLSSPTHYFEICVRELILCKHLDVISHDADVRLPDNFDTQSCVSQVFLAFDGPDSNVLLLASLHEA